MGVYIKGMEMPKKGSWVTLRVFPDGQCFLYSWCGNDFDFMAHLTAVPVPPHGRLIDANALVKEVEDIAKELPSDSIGVERFKLFAEFITEMPTVIPATRKGG